MADVNGILAAAVLSTIAAVVASVVTVKVVTDEGDGYTGTANEALAVSRATRVLVEDEFKKIAPILNKASEDSKVALALMGDHDGGWYCSSVGCLRSEDSCKALADSIANAGRPDLITHACEARRVAFCYQEPDENFVRCFPTNNVCRQMAKSERRCVGVE